MAGCFQEFSRVRFGSDFGVRLVSADTLLWKNLAQRRFDLRARVGFRPAPSWEIGEKDQPPLAPKLLITSNLEARVGIEPRPCGKRHNHAFPAQLVRQYAETIRSEGFY
jgi:hypothetical protein